MLSHAITKRPFSQKYFMRTKKKIIVKTFFLWLCKDLPNQVTCLDMNAFTPTSTCVVGSFCLNRCLRHIEIFFHINIEFAKNY